MNGGNGNYENEFSQSMTIIHQVIGTELGP
jgi:hypothetical protein